MTKLYLLIFSNTAYTREELVDFLDQDSSIQFWFYNMPNSVFVETAMSPRQLTDLIEDHFKSHRHFIVEITERRWGRLPKDHWDFFP